MNDLLQKMVRATLIAVIAGCGGYLFVLGGNTHEPAAYGPSVLTWLVLQWRQAGGDMSHAWLILPASLFLVWRRRRELLDAPKCGSRIGLAAIVVSLIFYWVGVRTQQPRLNVLSLIGLLWGVPCCIWGLGVGRLLLFPCAYLVFWMPLGFLSGLTFPLRLFSTVAGVFLLNGLGVPASRQGTAIFSSQPGGFSFDVADACSGLRSILALTALTALYAHLTQKTLPKKWCLFLASVPIAMAANIIRVVALGIAGHLFGQDAATRFYHDFSGYALFVTGVLLMMGVGALLNMDYAARFRLWKQRSSSLTSSSQA